MAPPAPPPPGAGPHAWTCGTMGPSAGLLGYHRARHTHASLPGLTGHAPSLSLGPASPKLTSRFCLPSPLELLGPEPLASGALHCPTTVVSRRPRVSGRGPGARLRDWAPSSASSARLSPGETGPRPQESPGPPIPGGARLASPTHSRGRWFRSLNHAHQSDPKHLSSLGTFKAQGR